MQGLICDWTGQKRGCGGVGLFSLLFSLRDLTNICLGICVAANTSKGFNQHLFSSKQINTLSAPLLTWATSTNPFLHSTRR